MQSKKHNHAAATFNLPQTPFTNEKRDIKEKTCYNKCIKKIYT